MTPARESTRIRRWSVLQPSHARVAGLRLSNARTPPGRSAVCMAARVASQDWSSMKNCATCPDMMQRSALGVSNCSGATLDPCDSAGIGARPSDFQHLGRRIHSDHGKSESRQFACDHPRSTSEIDDGTGIQACGQLRVERRLGIGFVRVRRVIDGHKPWIEEFGWPTRRTVSLAPRPAPGKSDSSYPGTAEAELSTVTACSESPESGRYSAGYLGPRVVSRL